MERMSYGDFEIGNRQHHGEYKITREEMLEFAQRYDPQPIHVDPEEARESVYGGLIASGWLTTAVWARMFVQGFLGDRARMQGALGIDELRWKKPVRAGDVLSITTEILDKEPYNDNLGLVRVGTTMENQQQETVLSMVGLALFARAS